MDIWKENILKDLEAGVFEFLAVGDFLTELNKEFNSEDNEMKKMVELKKVE